jgi:hypothetical protein
MIIITRSVSKDQTNQTDGDTIAVITSVTEVIIGETNVSNYRLALLQGPIANPDVLLESMNVGNGVCVQDKLQTCRCGP